MHLGLGCAGFGRNRRDNHSTLRCGCLLDDPAFTLRFREPQEILIAVSNCFGGKEKLVGRWQSLFILVGLLTGLLL